MKIVFYLVFLGKEMVSMAYWNISGLKRTFSTCCRLELLDIPELPFSNSFQYLVFLNAREKRVRDNLCEW